jgi:pimeloyl-ACP methyl ester carboxylesterase
MRQLTDTLMLVLLGSLVALQRPAERAVDDQALREYAGVYQWTPDAFVYLQTWTEINPTIQLVAFDDSGDVRTLYPTGRDRFSGGPGLGLHTPIESRVEFERNEAGAIGSLTWLREGSPSRTARRVDVEKHDDIHFLNGDVQLAGTVIAPATARGRHPAVVLVHGSGPANRQQILPFARRLIRHGMAVLTYDKRGVGGSTGDWQAASFEDLAGDVVAAFEYLKTRQDIDGQQIGLLGVSQAGWVMPLAAVRAKDIAFLISVSGAGIPVAETTIDQAQNEMTARGMKPATVAAIVELMKMQYHYARTGTGWDDYANARARLATRIGRPPDTFPGTPDDPAWRYIRLLYFYDPAPTLRQLRTPTLALFGELDNNILADKNEAAWRAALQAAGHPDFTLRVLPKANHMLLEAKVGSNAEMVSLQRFVPEYFTTVHEWLATRVRGYAVSPPGQGR